MSDPRFDEDLSLAQIATRVGAAIALTQRGRWIGNNHGSGLGPGTVQKILRPKTGVPVPHKTPSKPGALAAVLEL
jgi:hypothetical protein